MPILFSRLAGFRLLTAALLFTILSCGMNNKSTDLQRSQPGSSASIRAVTENAYPPLNFANSKGQGIGLEYDLTNKIAQLIGRPVVWNLSNWDVMIQSVRQDMFDVGMDGITITPERKKQVQFSIPYITISQIMLVRNEENPFVSAAEFALNPNLKIGVQPGTTGFYVATDLLETTPENPGRRIVSFESFGASVQGLVSGDIDMVIVDESSAKRWVNSTNQKLKTIPEVLSSEEIAYIFPKGSPLVKEFNAAIKKLQDDGSIDKMLIYWFSEYQDQ